MSFMAPRKIECQHEADVLASVATRRWPDKVDAELRMHAASCEICADAVAVAAAFRDDDEVLPGDMRLPDSSIVWWRSQLRAREEAARAAARPITIAHVAGVSCAVGLAGVVFGASSAWLQGWLSWAWTGIKSFSPPTISFTMPTISIPAPVVTLVTEHALLVGGIAALLIIGPVAVYLAARE